MDKLNVLHNYVLNVLKDQVDKNQLQASNEVQTLNETIKRQLDVFLKNTRAELEFQNSLLYIRPGN